MIGVLIPIFLIQSIGVALDLFQLKSRYENALQSQAAMVTDLVGESIILPLWDFDMDLVDNLVASVRRLTASQGNETPVVISADKSVLYEQVMAVMDRLKTSGTRKIGLLVKKPN